MTHASILRTALAASLALALLVAVDGLAQNSKKAPTTSAGAARQQQPAAKQDLDSSLTALQRLSKGTPVLDSFGLARNLTVAYAPQVKMIWKSSGGLATHYRASESSSFGGASWVAFDGRSPGAMFELSAGEGSKTIHFQLMNDRGDEALKSEVANVSVQRLDPPVITSFEIDGGAPQTDDDTVKAEWTYSGTATHYRLSESQNFSGAIWNSPATQPSGVMIQLASAAEGEKTVYLQLRRDDSSPVGASDQILLKKTLIKHTVTGATDLRALLVEAKARGYPIETTKLQGEYCNFWIPEKGDPRTPALVARAEELPWPPATTCETRLFHGKTLAPGWTMQSILIEPALSVAHPNTCLVTLPPVGTDDPAITIETRHAGGPAPQQSACIVVSLTLQGPGGDWREAFVP